MNVESQTKKDRIDQIFELLRNLETRVNRIEDYLELGPVTTPTSPPAESFRPAPTPNGTQPLHPEGSLEFKIGEYWLAYLGTVVLLLGLAFFISYPFEAIPPAATSLIGYLAVASIFGLAFYWRTTHPHLSKILYGGNLVLLYFATLRLHFFSSHPLITSKAVALMALVAVLGWSFYSATKRQSELLTGLVLFLGFTTALMSDTPPFALAMVTVTAAAGLFVLVRYNWQNIAILSLVMAYLTHLLWLLNNPLLGRSIQVVSEHHFNLIYLFLLGTAFACANLFREKSAFTDLSELVVTTLNALGLFVLGFLSISTFFKSELSLLNFLLSVFFVGVAALNWIHHQSKYASAIYACFGYLALTIAIFAQFDSPHYFVWLGWQSLLVISTAIWFRSRILIVVNSLIYFGIFVCYLCLAPSNDFVNLSYAIVALISARVLNWKKERLELKTDMIRIAYLASAFVIVLYGLSQAVPANFVSLSWLGAALFYFGMSRLLNNIKYRWMAILTIFVTIARVFLVDMARLDAVSRIFLFLAVGAVLVGVSLFYTKFRNKTAAG